MLTTEFIQTIYQAFLYITYLVDNLMLYLWVYEFIIIIT